jgi:DNA-nicking Smr family endonuclease
MENDEEELFLKEVSDVQRHKRAGRVRVRDEQGSARDRSLEHRRLAAVAEQEADRNLLTEEGIEPLEPWYVLEFKRPGVQNGVFRKFKQGRYEMEARLDLHRMTVRIARKELFDFIDECHRLGLRCVILIHGKGESKADQQRSSILKGCVNHWLRQLDVVQGFHSARQHHGGTGAAYVLLKKSEEKKRENRERITKGRIDPPI